MRRAPFLALLVTFTLASVAPREARADAATMQAQMETYFDGEKRGGIAFFGVGAVALGSSVVMFTRESKFLRGMSYPVAAVGLIQVIAGAVVYLRTDSQVADLEAKLQSDPAGYRDAELARMRRVNRSFVILEIVELALLAAGVTAIVWAGRTDDDTLAGAGVGLAVQSALMLGLDYLASRRAEIYTGQLEDFDPAAARVIGISIGGVF